MSLDLDISGEKQDVVGVSAESGSVAMSGEFDSEATAGGETLVVAISGEVSEIILLSGSGDFRDAVIVGQSGGIAGHAVAEFAVAE